MDHITRFIKEVREGKRRSHFPPYVYPNRKGLVALGGELSVEIVLEAYSKGVFPWTGTHPIPWAAPNPRMLLYPQNFHCSRSFRKFLRKHDYQVVFDRNFPRVMRACASITRSQESETWITGRMFSVYGELHREGVAHSVEVYDGVELCGGLYGLSLGKAFFGESMFSRKPNTSKLALYTLCQALAARDFDFIDCQQETPHIATLGAYAIPHEEYIATLEAALQKEPHYYNWGRWLEED